MAALCCATFATSRCVECKEATADAAPQSRHPRSKHCLLLLLLLLLPRLLRKPRRHRVRCTSRRGVAAHQQQQQQRQEALCRRTVSLHASSAHVASRFGSTAARRRVATAASLTWDVQTGRWQVHFRRWSSTVPARAVSKCAIVVALRRMVRGYQRRMMMSTRALCLSISKPTSPLIHC